MLIISTHKCCAYWHTHMCCAYWHTHTCCAYWHACVLCVLAMVIGMHVWCAYWYAFVPDWYTDQCSCVICLLVLSCFASLMKVDENSTTTGIGSCPQPDTSRGQEMLLFLDVSQTGDAFPPPPSRDLQQGMTAGDNSTKAGVHNYCPVWTSLHNNQVVGTTRSRTGSALQPTLCQ